MGNLVDHFIIRLKPGVDQHDHHAIVDKLPVKYLELYEYIAKYENGYIPLNHIMDRRLWNEDEGYPPGELGEEFESHHKNCGIKFSCRYRGESLLQVLRFMFYDTLLILENVNDWNKENIFQVVEGDVISEKDWFEKPSQDQDCVQQVIKNFREAGFTVIAQDGL